MPPDVRVCANHGDHGYCRNTLTVNAANVTGKAWADTLSKAVIVPAQSWAKMKAWQLNVCHEIKCDQGVGSWTQVINDLDLNRAK